jgi:hypothetical protein
MSDENVAGLGGQEAGQPLEPVQTGQTQPTEPEAQPITHRDFETLRTELHDEVERLVQARSDQLDRRVQKKIADELKAYDTKVEALKAAGIDMSDADIKADRKRIALNAVDSFEESETAPAQGAGLQSTAIDESKVNEVNVKAAKLVAEHGFTISASDPENKGLEEMIKSNPDPDTWYAGWEKAMTSKAARLAKPPVAPAARMPSLATGGASPAGSREQQLLQELDTLQHRPDFAQKVNIDRRKEILKELDGLEGG